MPVATEGLLINQEFKTLIPSLQPEEFKMLEESILEEGVRDAIVTWNGYIVDGHNRYDIITKHAIKDYRVVNKNFEDTEAVKIWIKKNQIGRRNISTYLRAEYHMEVREWEDRRKQAKANHSKAVSESNVNRNNPCFVKSQIMESVNLTQDLAKKLEIGEQTASRIIQIKEKAPEAIKAKVRSGDYSINEVYSAIKTIERNNGHEPISEAKIEAVIERKPIEKAHVANNSGEFEWYTPQSYIEAARNLMGSIDVDPASSDVANRTVRATKYFTIADDGRKQEWRGNVWMNPPYSQPVVTEFCDILVSKFLSKQISQACVLVNNATETNFYQNMLKYCSAVCFIKGRVRFVDKQGVESGAPLQGQTILYFGSDRERFANCFREFGIILYAS